jgi:hypothetical protein
MTAKQVHLINGLSVISMKPIKIKITLEFVSKGAY